MSSRNSHLPTLGFGVLVLLGLGLMFMAISSGLQSPAPLTPLAEQTATVTTVTPTQVVSLTTADQTPAAVLPTATAAPITGQVAAGTIKINLRQTPGTAGEVITEVPELTALLIVGRTADNTWLQVQVATGEQGWVAAEYVDVMGDVATLAVAGEVKNQAGTGIPYISGISSRAREIYLAGQTVGNRSFVFSLVGDSNTDNPAFFAPFDWGNYNLGDYAHLQDTINYFKGSYARDSVAAKGGFSTAKVLDPAYATGECNGGESPLACEYRINKPSVALILLGTGDQHAWDTFEGRYRQIIEYTINQGIVPVLITKADDLESTDNTAPANYINNIIIRLSREYDIPLLNLRQAVAGLPNRGCGPDGFHFNVPPDGLAADFTGDHLQYGYPMRNLTALEMLDALRRYVLY